jgi:hypothetical protein
MSKPSFISIEVKTTYSLGTGEKTPPGLPLQLTDASVFFFTMAGR